MAEPDRTVTPTLPPAFCPVCWAESVSCRTHAEHGVTDAHYLCGGGHVWLTRWAA